MKSLSLIAAALILGGCSFIDDWSTFSTDPSQSMDGGPADSGRTDAGPDACVDECDADTQSGCNIGAVCIRGDSCGTICVDCAGVCDTCTTTCVVEGNGSCYCPGELEGGVCAADSDCQEGLGCLNDICHKRCLTPGSASECEGALHPYCVELNGGTFCVPEMCNPLLLGACTSPATCALLGVSLGEPEQGQPQCIGAGDKQENDVCVADGTCAPGLSCIMTLTLGTAHCVRTCDLAGPGTECDPQFSTGCAPDLLEIASTLSDGTALGVCVPRDEDGDGVPFPFDCNDADSSVYPGAYEECDDIDNDCDPTTPDGQPILGLPCDDPTDLDLCEGGALACVDGTPVCVGDEGDTSAETESCDGLDNDCDGITDNPRCVADSDCCGADTCSAITLRCE